MDIEKRIRDIWHKHEIEVGQRIRPEFREAVKELIGSDYYDEDHMRDLDGLISEYIKLAMAWGGLSSSKGSAVDSSKRRYHKCFERRVYLAEFVLGAIYTPHELFIPLLENASLSKRRVDWKKMVIEWNESNPSDQMSLSVLKVEFYRAIKEDAVMREILAREWRETESYLQLVEQARDSLRKFSNVFQVRITKRFPFLA